MWVASSFRLDCGIHLIRSPAMEDALMSNGLSLSCLQPNGVGELALDQLFVLLVKILGHSIGFIICFPVLVFHHYYITTIITINPLSTQLSHL